MIKNYLLLIAVFASIIACSNIGSVEGYKNVTTDEAKVLIKQGVLILDVRTAEEVSLGKIEGSVNIDFYSEDFEEQLDKLDKSKDILVYCKSGGRSVKSVKKIVGKTFKQVYNLLGGYEAWKKAM